MLKRVLSCGLALLMVAGISGCTSTAKNVKIGVSLGVGPAARWAQEQVYMEERAAEIGADIEVRLNTTDEPKTQKEDCFELIDGGIDVLIITPRDVNNVSEIIDYAKSKKVRVISYSRMVQNSPVDLFVGYDCNRIGQTLGQHLSEKVPKGDYILLAGDPGDNNAKLLYEGAMRYISQIEDNINILLDTYIDGWSPDEAKKMVLDAVGKNGNKVDAILAPNDKIAGACAEALSELGITDNVIITGMDAELDALQRIVAGTQDITTYMDLEELAHTAVNEAYNLATNQDVNVNSNFENGLEDGADAYLINGKVVIKQNLDKVIIERGTFTREQIYGAE